MWQKLSTVPAQGAVLFLLTAMLFVSKPELTSLDVPNYKLELNSASNDPSIEDLFTKNEVAKGKMLAGLKNPKESKITVPTPKLVLSAVASQTVYKPTYISAPTDIEPIIRQYASQYGANPEVMIRIAKCESGFRSEAISPSGAYHGMYQFVASTWQSNRRAMGLSDNLELMHNAEEAIKTAAFKMGRDGYGAWPVCSQKAFANLQIN